jgi:exodeoxyribonuclease VII small subunit
MPKADGPSPGRSQPDIFTNDSDRRSTEESLPLSPAEPARVAGEGAESAQGGDSNLSSNSDADPLPSSFESALNQLEALVARMESGELSLEQSLSAYKRGAMLLQYCQGKLHDAQQQVKILEAGVLRDFSGAGESGQ